MAIVKMNKFTLLTFESQKEELLKRLQGLAEVEFINLQSEELVEKHEELQGLNKDDVDSEHAKFEENLSNAKSALEFVSHYTPKKSMIKSYMTEKEALTIAELEERFEGLNWQDAHDKVKEQETLLHSIEANIAKLQGDIELLTPWEALDAPLESFEELKMTSCFIGSIARQYEEDLYANINNAYIEVVFRGNADTNILVLVNKDKEEEVAEILRGYGFSSFKTEHKEVPHKIITDYRSEIEELKTKTFFVKEELATFEKHEETLKVAFEYFSNKVGRKVVSTNFLKTETVVTIQGWNPVDFNDEVKTICNDTLGEDYYLNFEDVKEEEIHEVPIKLKNGELVSNFESVTGMYSLPRYDEVDPTPLLTPFYLVFFGMMVADVGYGLLTLIVTLVVLKFAKLGDDQKKFVKFGMYLSFPTIFFGFIYGSFFGDLLPLPKLIDPQMDVNTVLILSILLGVIQIFAGLGIKVYMLCRIGRYADAFFDVGSWVITLVSIAVFGLGGMAGFPDIVITIGKYGMIAGMLLVVYAGGRREKSTGGKIGEGLYNLYGITGYVSDLVSYTRLMALGLAGGSIAAAINLIIGTMPGIAVIVFGPLIFLFGQIFNMGLSLLGAYVHTARLQYIEYFNKFYEGGGKPFVPFKATEKYINIKRD